MEPTKIVVVDVETTGLYPTRDRVVEIALVVTTPDGKIGVEYETLVNPNRDMGPTHLHGVSAGDALHAPQFSDIAGDILSILSKAQIIAGHNAIFDKTFLTAEFGRVGIELPEFPILCTCNLLGRSSLGACCEEFGILRSGIAHSALSDARDTVQLISVLCADDLRILDPFLLAQLVWPILPPKNAPCVTRSRAKDLSNRPPDFLERLSQRIHHNNEATPSNVLAYLALIDRVLEDRVISESESKLLEEMAVNWGLNIEQIQTAHDDYLKNLAAVAISDGAISDAEHRDLHQVARLLGRDDDELDTILSTAAAQFATAGLSRSLPAESVELRNKSVCFTGELTTTINGNAITRAFAEELARKAGMNVLGSVTKKLDILVVADPNTQSGKAKKARDYKCRILADIVFWRMLGVNID